MTQHNSITAVTPIITILPAHYLTVSALADGRCLQCDSPRICYLDGGGRGCIECGQVYAPDRQTTKEASAR